MKKLLRHWAAAAAGIAAATAFTSCTYDPYYYGNGSVSGSYSSGYGYGYGYGGSGFSTSFFVSTGDPDWGYDPYCYSYYDYRRRCYYDPYLYGYYPVGYRPPVMIGCPHPHGWRPGRGYCPPPTYVRNVTVVNYHNREAAYRNTRYDWARQVRQKPVVQRPEESRPARGPAGGSQNQWSRPAWNRQDGIGNRPRPAGGASGSKIEETRKPGRQNARESQGARLPSGYNTPVTRQTKPRQEATREAGGPSWKAANQPRNRTQASPGMNPRAGQPQTRPTRQAAPPPRQDGERGRTEEQRPQNNRGSGRAIRHLGDG